MEQFWVGFEPFFHGLDREFASQRRLRKLMVVQDDIALQGLRQVFTGFEVVRLQDVADAAVASFHHSIGLRSSWLGQAVLDAKRFTQLVEFVLPGWLAVLGAEP